jgi:hypothetical protein
MQMLRRRTKAGVAETKVLTEILKKGRKISFRTIEIRAEK